MYGCKGLSNESDSIPSWTLEDVVLKQEVFE